MSFANDLSFTVELALGAAKIVLGRHGNVERLIKNNSASQDEAVTEVDRASQRYIVERLRQRFPGDGIIGEESETGETITAEIPDPMGRNWVIDPIDGTNNFVAGFPNFAVCIGLMDKGVPVLGVVHDVVRDWSYAGARGCGATLNGRLISVPKTPLSNSSILMLTSNLLVNGKLPAWVPKWMGQTNWKIRLLGSAALEACQVGAGVAHAAVTVNGKLWDLAAPAAVVIEAGGVITDLAGQPIFPFDLRNYTGAKVPFVAAGPAALPQVLQDINQQ